MSRLLGVVLVLMVSFSIAAHADTDCTECHGADGEPSINMRHLPYRFMGI